LFECWNLDLIDIIHPLHVHLRNLIELISLLLVDPDVMLKWTGEVVFDCVLGINGIKGDIPEEKMLNNHSWNTNGTFIYQ